MASPRDTENFETVRVARVVDPGLPIEVARGVATELPRLLSLRLPAKAWVIDVVCEAIVCDEQVGVGRVLHEVGGQLPHEDRDIEIGLTGLPRRSGTRPVVAEVSRDDAVIEGEPAQWITERSHGHRRGGPAAGDVAGTTRMSPPRSDSAPAVRSKAALLRVPGRRSAR